MVSKACTPTSTRGQSTAPRSAPAERVVAVAALPQVLHKAEHDVGLAAAAAVARLAQRHVRRVVAEQLLQRPQALPAARERAP